MIGNINIVPAGFNVFRSQNAKANAEQEQADLAPCARKPKINFAASVERRKNGKSRKDASDDEK